MVEHLVFRSWDSFERNGEDGAVALRLEVPVHM